MAVFGRFTRSLQALYTKESEAPVGEDISLGAVNFGNAGLQCNFVLSSSEWGKIGGQQGGVLYFSMTVKQSNDARIRWAEFDVILRNYKDNTQAPAVLLMYLEPKSVSGQDIIVNVKERGLFKPKVDVGGGPVKVAAEVGEKEKEKSGAKRYYWTLTAYGGAEEDSGRITRATWEWQGNKKAPQASTRTLQGGAVVVSVIEGDFEIELRLRCRLQSRTQEAGEWVKNRFGFREKKPMIRTLHSPAANGNVESAATKLKDNIRSFNESEQTKE